MMSPITTDLALMDHRERLATAECIRHVRIARAALGEQKVRPASSLARSGERVVHPRF